MKDSRHAWRLVYYLSEGFKADLESGVLPCMLGVWFTTLVKDSRHAWRIQGMLGIWFTTLAKDSRHAWSLVYYLSEGFKACLESGLLP